MRLSQIHHGRRTTVRLVSLNEPVGLALREEIRLRRDSSGQWVLSHPRGRFDVLPDDDEQAAKLEACAVGNPQTLTWVVTVDSTPRGFIVHTVIEAFHTYWRPEAPIDLGIDASIVSKVAKLAKRDAGMSFARDWLTDHFLIDSEGSVKRMIVVGSADQQGGFRVLGNGYAIDVTNDGRKFRIKSLVKPNRKQEGFVRPESLVEGHLSFVDASAATEVRRFLAESARSLTSSTNRTYIQVWMDYQRLEDAQLQRQSSELGWVRYNSFAAKENGRYRFELNQANEASSFLSRLGETEQLEAGTSPPGESTETNENSSQDRPRTFVGAVTNYDIKTSMIELTPRDLDASRTPPPEGYLYLSLTGDQSRLRRRDEAIERMMSGSAANPTLLALLEGADVSIRKRTHEKAISAEVRKLFRHPPTQNQRDAIDIAINTPDIAIIQGPPGTGKTTVIAAILTRLNEISQNTHSRHHGRTLLSSFQHDALDNAIERAAQNNLPPARFGGKPGRRNGEEQIQSWLHQARERVQANLATLPADRPR